ncbi:MAG: FGGY family carbohydrate kinase, partial [Trueperaceae bacterium]
MSRTVHLGVDLGTSGVKVVAVDEAGRIVDEAQRPYPLSTPRPGWAEQDPDDWIRGSAEAVREVVGRVAGRVAGRVGSHAVTAIGLSGQMHTAVLVDEAGRPVRPAI